MDLTVTQLAGQVACIQPKGRLDAPGADAIGLRFTAAVAGSAGKVAIDLSGLSFLASMGIRLLISNARAVALKGGKVVLFGAGPLVQEVLNDSALDQIMPIVSTQDEAMALLAD
jgi:anti-sigma B factor antagonist